MVDDRPKHQEGRRSPNHHHSKSFDHEPHDADDALHSEVEIAMLEKLNNAESTNIRVVPHDTSNFGGSLEGSREAKLLEDAQVYAVCERYDRYDSDYVMGEDLPNL